MPGIRHPHPIRLRRIAGLPVARWLALGLSLLLAFASVAPAMSHAVSGTGVAPNAPGHHCADSSGQGDAGRPLHGPNCPCCHGAACSCVHLTANMVVPAFFAFVATGAANIPASVVPSPPEPDPGERLRPPIT